MQTDLKQVTELKGVVWSAILRNDTVLVEAGEDMFDGEVVKTAQKLLKKKPTAGWEFEKGRGKHLKGTKFHVFESVESVGDDSGMIVWSFAAVTEKSLEEPQVRSFLEKLVYITVPMRESDEWRNGDLLAAQASFAPILLNKMEQVASQGRLAMVNEEINTTKELMAVNIERALERYERLEDLDEQAKDLNAMSKQFKVRAKQVKKFKMWQNAKHGLVVGTLVTGAVAAVVVPPLVAIL